MHKVRIKIYKFLLFTYLIMCVISLIYWLLKGQYWYEWLVMFCALHIFYYALTQDKFKLLRVLKRYEKKDWQYVIKNNFDVDSKRPRLAGFLRDYDRLILAVAYFNTNQDELFLAQLTKFPGRPKDYLYCESAKAFYTYLYALVKGKDNVEYCYKRYTWIPDKDSEMEKQALLIYDLTHNSYSRKQLCEILPQVENDRVREFLKSTYIKKN